MINLDEEIVNRLNEEENASQLISELLEDYFFMKGRETPEKLEEAIALTIKRTDISQDEINKIVAPLKEKQERLIKEKKNQELREQELKEQQKKKELLLFQKRETIFKSCSGCQKEFNLNNITESRLLGVICFECKKNPEIMEKIIKISYGR